MRPQQWQPPVALSPEETAIVRRVHRAKLFVFLREERHVLFSAAFQEELARRSMPTRPKGIRRFRPPNWRWRRSCKPTRASPMMR